LENLADLIQSNHIRELLAQGTSQQRWQQERDVEREEAEKKRQLPIHMHINQDHIEAAHLVSAMFAEVPNMALYGQANKKKMISKGFRRLFDGQSRQAFTGPPENTRDLIMAATRALRQGEWERCSELLMRLRMWSVLQPVVAAHVQRLIQIQVKETALETYLISYSPYFTSISASTLTQMFQLSHAQVFKVASTLILQEQLAGAWDQPLEVILMQQGPPSRLQRAALSYSEKVAALVDQNERMLDGRHGYQPFNKGRGQRDDNKKREGGDDHEDRRRDDGKRGYRSNWVHRGRSQRFGDDRRRHRN
jgi:translation initiation factor 3 subunit C